MSKGTKRVPVKTQAEWEELVLRCLNPKDRWDWGCLSEDNILFQIETLRHTEVPYNVVRSLFDKGLIRIDDNIMSNKFYKYIPPTPRRRIMFEGGIVEPDNDAVPILIQEGSVAPKELVEKYGTKVMDSIKSGSISIFNRRKPVKEEPIVGTSRRVTF